MPRTTIDTQREEAKGVAERVRWARELAEATITELAADIGVDSTTIRHIEKGARLPSIHVLMSLCHVLRISPQYLLWGSLEGVDADIAVQLKARHPELYWPAASPAPGSTHNSESNTAHPPRIRARTPDAGDGTLEPSATLFIC